MTHQILKRRKEEKGRRDVGKLSKQTLSRKGNAKLEVSVGSTLTQPGVIHNWSRNCKVRIQSSAVHSFIHFSFNNYQLSLNHALQGAAGHTWSRIPDLESSCLKESKDVTDGTYKKWSKGKKDKDLYKMKCVTQREGEGTRKVSQR